jgi:hypothetical protein
MNAPNLIHWTLNSCIFAFRSVWVHLTMFHYYTILGAKQVELVQLIHKFVPWNCIGIFRNERTRSTPLDHKLMFWCVSKCSGPFGNVSLLHETRCKTGWTGAINAHVFAMKSFWNFSQRMHPTHSIGPKTHVLLHFVVFGCILDCFVTARSLVQNRLNWCNYCKSFCHEVASEFFATNAPDPLHWTLNSCFGASRWIWVHLAMFRYYTKLGAKRVEQVQWMQMFMPWSCIKVFCNERTQSTPLDPKLMFVCVL